jgi:hypothetical protein
VASSIMQPTADALRDLVVTVNLPGGIQFEGAVM